MNKDVVDSLAVVGSLGWASGRHRTQGNADPPRVAVGDSHWASNPPGCCAILCASNWLWSAAMRPRPGAPGGASNSACVWRRRSLALISASLSASSQLLADLDPGGCESTIAAAAAGKAPSCALARRPRCCCWCARSDGTPAARPWLRLRVRAAAAPFPRLTGPADDGALTTTRDESAAI